MIFKLITPKLSFTRSEKTAKGTVMKGLYYNEIKILAALQFL